MVYIRSMVDIERETNIERLREMARLLDRENMRLHARLLELTRKLAEARGEVATQLQLEISALQQTLDARNQALFGRSSEKRPSPPTEKANAEATTAPTRGHGPTAQPSLPIMEEIHHLDEPDRACPKCGGALAEWDGQFEEAEEVDVVERSFRIVRHRRQKYRCACGCIETALGPQKLIEGGRYSVGFAVEVAVSKYTDHLPLARQVRQMARAGLTVGTQALWDQIFALSRHLEPTYKALRHYVLGAPVVGADETTWQLMDGKSSGKWWVWAVTRPDAVFYQILSSRSAQAAGTVLGGFHGIVVADGYSAYRALQKQTRDGDGVPDFDLACCWAHCRRKFVEAEPHYPQATQAIDLIRGLYRIEERGRESGDPAKLLELRRTDSAKLMEAIRLWLVEQAKTALPQSSLGKAIGYAQSLWPGFTRFLGNSQIPLDNNGTERVLRGVAVGRKNHYGSRSIRGTEVAALFYSLIESAKLSGIEPAYYLREATARAITNPGTVTLPVDICTADTT